MPKARRDYAAALDYRRTLEEQDGGGIAEMQLQKVREVWRDAVADVPYYERLVREGRAPHDIATWEDFRCVPELTREILQDHEHEFLRKSGPHDIKRLTGGSTGSPVRFGVYHCEEEVIRLLKLVLWSRAGYEPGDRLFLIWGHSHLLGTGWRRYANHFRRKAKDAVLGYRRVDAYRMDRSRAEDYLEKLRKFSPAGLIGYSTILDLLVRLLPDRRSELRDLALKFVMPAAESAPKSDSFSLLAETFGCPVIQEFGGLDFGQVAMKFADEPFEVFAEYNFLEGAGSGEQEEQRPETRGQMLEPRGEEALVTALYRRYLPLLRYQQGDLLGGCRKLAHGHVASFDRLEGRINDMVALSDGSAVHCSAVLHCIRPESTVLNIQMVLEDSGPKILLVTSKGYDTAAESRIRQRLAQISPVLEDVPVELTEDVQTSRAGKRRWFVDKRTERSKVASTGVND